MLSSTPGHSNKPFLLAMVFIACALRAGAESGSEPLISEVATDPKSLSSTERDDGTDPEEVAVNGDHDDDDYVEEVVVTARPPERGKAPTLEFLTELYGSRRSGARLYRRGKHAESFPYLLAAARRGFKMAQARVSFLYQQGLGTPPDPTAALAFLGIAAKPPTHPEIRRRFHEIWGRVPPEQKPGLEELIEQYEAKYGARANRISCDLSHRAGTYFKKLTCRFMDECSIFVNSISGLAPAPELQNCPGPAFQ